MLYTLLKENIIQFKYNIIKKNEDCQKYLLNLEFKIRYLEIVLNSYMNYLFGINLDNTLIIVLIKLHRFNLILVKNLI